MQNQNGRGPPPGSPVTPVLEQPKVKQGMEMSMEMLPLDQVGEVSETSAPGDAEPPVDAVFFPTDNLYSAPDVLFTSMVSGQESASFDQPSQPDQETNIETIIAGDANWDAVDDYLNIYLEPTSGQGYNQPLVI
ncbi:hypothetical protein NDN08_001286 [Rhodosorus marinus]|uniref:Uncharacterized protein n=1 Tax=Rhodosorus marinus TaxID=101924 RepID=A0AAV8UQE7_9RHOD|nr:hypothetical protein NDN08_001286 [Rhodosorus marinus]